MIINRRHTASLTNYPSEGEAITPTGYLGYNNNNNNNNNTNNLIKIKLWLTAPKGATPVN